MSNYTNLKNAIQSVIKANGNNEITGPILQAELLSMVTTLGAGYQYIGVAQPSTNPGTPDARVMYLAYLPGTYVNFGGLTVTGFCVLKYDTVWTKEDIPISDGGGADFLTEPDDLTLEAVGNTNILKFANRSYNSENPNGMGYKILRNDLTFSEQVTDASTIYEIRYDFDLSDETVNIPSDCVLRFNGGRISNGEIVGNNTKINSGLYQIFNDDLVLGGTWNVGEIYPEWFGAKGDGTTNDATALQNSINAAITLNCILALNSFYKITSTLNIPYTINIIGKIAINTQNPMCGFKCTQTALALNGSRNAHLENIAFIQDGTTANVDAITITGNCSLLSIVGCLFKDITGYAIKFISNTYSQMVTINRLSCWNCGGIIGGDGSANPTAQKGIVVTCATLSEINLDDGVNQVSPQSIILDLSGFREYTAQGIVIEGTTGNNGTAVKMSNNKWNNIDGIHVEFHSNKCTVGLEIAQSLYQQSSSASVWIKNISGPLVVSANYTTVFINGIQHYDGTRWYSITGSASKIIFKNLSTSTPTFNIFNYDDFGKFIFEDFRLMEVSAPLPITLQNYVELFKWTANDGDYKAFTNQYFNPSVVTPSASLDVNGIVDTGVADIGKVMRIKPNTTDYFPVIALRFKTGIADKFAGKIITLAMTYRVNTEATQGLAVANVINYWVAHDGCTLLNQKIFDGNIAIAICSMVVKSGTYGFCGNNGSNMNGISTLDIIGINVVLGDTAIPTPFQF